MLNTIILQGRLTKDAEVRYTQSNKAVASFTVAVDRFGKNSETDFINCVAWEKTATFVENYFHKGDMILVQGRMQSRNYEDKDGHKRTAFEVLVNEVNFCANKTKNNEQAGNVSSTTFTELSDDTELPF